MDNPYVRQALRATRTGAADPELEVDQWLDRLDYALEGALAEDPVEEAWELLSMWAALERIRPEFFERAGAADTRAQAERRLAEDGPGLASSALARVDPERWLQEAERLAEAMAEAGFESEDEQVHRAADLVQDLDEAQLLVYALERWAPDEKAIAELSDHLRECEQWLGANAELVGDASVLIQAIALTLRPELEQMDPALARTAAKFPGLLDAVTAMERELTLEDIEPLSPEELAAMPESAVGTDNASDLQWLPTAGEPPLAAASGASPPHILWRGLWYEPGGTRTARLVVLAEPAPDDQLVHLTFQDIHGHPVETLTGTSVRLGGVASTIERAIARFRLGDLRAAAGEPELWVGSQRWKLQDER